MGSEYSRNEVEVALALKAGDPTAMEDLRRLYGDALQSFALPKVDNRVDAEDVASNTILRALEYASQLNAPGQLKTWLFVIARNLCIDVVRARKYMAVAPEECVRLADSVRSESIEPGQGEMVRNALAGLPTEQRSAVVLCYLQNLSLLDAAALRGVPKWRLKRDLALGRAALRQILSPDRD